MKENIHPIIESGQLNYLDKDKNNYLTKSTLGFDVLFVSLTVPFTLYPLSLRANTRAFPINPDEPVTSAFNLILLILN